MLPVATLCGRWARIGAPAASIYATGPQQSRGLQGMPERLLLPAESHKALLWTAASLRTSNQGQPSLACAARCIHRMQLGGLWVCALSAVSVGRKGLLAGLYSKPVQQHAVQGHRPASNPGQLTLPPALLMALAPNLDTRHAHHPCISHNVGEPR